MANVNILLAEFLAKALAESSYPVFPGGERGEGWITTPCRRGRTASFVSNLTGSAACEIKDMTSMSMART